MRLARAVGRSGGLVLRPAVLRAPVAPVLRRAAAVAPQLRHDERFAALATSAPQLVAAAHSSQPELADALAMLSLALTGGSPAPWLQQLQTLSQQQQQQQLQLQQPESEQQRQEAQPVRDLLYEMVKRQYKPSVIRRKRKHGFMKRNRTANGRRILQRKRNKGRRRLSA